MNQQETALLCNRHARLKAARGDWDDQWEDIALYSMPGKADFVTQRSEGDPSRNRNIYDPTAAVSNHTLASHMHMAMTSPASKWFEQKFKDEMLRDQHDAKIWVEQCTDYMYSAINDSNFVSIINELYQNLIAFGTACLEVTYIIDPVDGFKLVFRDIPLSNLVFLENVHRQVDTVFEEMPITFRQAKQLIGDVKIDRVEEGLKEDPDGDITILRVVKPNEKFDPNKPLDPMKRRFISSYIVDKVEVKAEGLYELPYMVPRWGKMTTEPYGYGPGLLALPDVRTINEAKRLELRGWEKAIDPPLWGMAGAIVGKLRLEASGFTKVRDRNAIGVIGQGTHWQATQLKSDEIRQSIQAVYLIDQLIMPERPNATATEVEIRYNMMQKVLGPTMGRLQAELLNPMVNRIFNIMLRNGELPEIPEELAGAETEVRYTGPLARAQKSEESQAVERLINFIMGTAQLDPSVVDIIDMRLAARVVADQWGVPQEVMRSQEAVEEIDAQRAEQQAQQQAQQEQVQGAMVEEQQATATTASVEAMRSVAGAM